MPTLAAIARASLAAPVAPVIRAASSPMYRGNPQRTGYYDATGLQQLTGVQWRFQVGDSVRSSAAIADGVIYFGSHDQHLYAVDLATGTHRWKVGTAYWVESSPAVADGMVYFGSNDGNFYALR